MNARNRRDPETEPLLGKSTKDKLQTKKNILTPIKIFDRFVMGRERALVSDQPTNHQDGVYYRVTQPAAITQKSEGDRLNLYKQTAVALISEAGHTPLSPAEDPSILLNELNEMLKKKGKKSEVKVIQEFTAGKLSIPRKVVKNMLKQAEGVMMTRRIDEDRRLLHQSSGGNDLSFKTSRVGNVMYSALLKGGDALDNPPRNHREMVFTSNRGVVQGDVHSYLVAGTDTLELVEKSSSRRAAINDFFGGGQYENGEQAPELSDVHIYRTLIDGDDNLASMVTNKFKADNESKLAKDALEGDKAAGIKRINTTQKVSALGVFRENKVITHQLKAAIKGYEGVLNRVTSEDASAADISTGYNNMNRSLLGLEEGVTLPAGVETNENSIKDVLKEKVAELKYLQAAYKAATPGIGARILSAVKRLFGRRSKMTFADPRVMKPVIEGMIINRVGGGSMSCKSGKDRAGVISGIEVAAEKKLATMTCDQLGDAKSDVTGVFENKDFAQLMYSETTQDYLKQIGADNCDGVFGTKDGHKIVPEWISSYLKEGMLTRLKDYIVGNPVKMDQYQEMRAKFSLSHEGAKINEIKEISILAESDKPYHMVEDSSSVSLLRQDTVASSREHLLSNSVDEGMVHANEGGGLDSTPDPSPEAGRGRSPRG